MPIAPLNPVLTVSVSRHCQNPPGGDRWEAESPVMESHSDPKLFKSILLFVKDFISKSLISFGKSIF